MRFTLFLLPLFLLAFSGCAAPVGTAFPTPTAAADTMTPAAAVEEIAEPTLASTPTIPAASSPTPTAAVSSTATPEADVGIRAVCSPLEGIRLEELGQPDLLKHPFQLPRPGMDDGHHGADFAYWSRGERKSMFDHPIHSILDGKVAAVLPNQIPYGFTVIIETPLERLPQGWQDQMQMPTPAPTVPPTGSLFCPAETSDYAARPGRSLYLLYAHMNEEPALSVGQVVACGETIGLVGTTGNSVNAHLHLETRVGPAGVTFSEMNHYDNRASENEMRSYCTWRVSGLFQMIDPMLLLSLQP
jgi:murein DD-endopeptidase MepM/ murein hydrolase activator NlpD